MNRFGNWDPAQQYWGEEDEPIDDWAKPLIALGPRPLFGMEQVLPGSDSDSFGSDPFLEANELTAMGDRAGARHLRPETRGALPRRPRAPRNMLFGYSSPRTTRGSAFCCPTFARQEWVDEED